MSLLRLIEQKAFRRLGGQQVFSTDARLIVATNEDLADAVDQGIFRQDLYYRLDVFRIAMPPLRDREGDIPLLVDDFLKGYNRAFKKNITCVSPKCMDILQGSEWPGNVRELKNVIQRAVVICQGDTLGPEHLPLRLQPTHSTSPTVRFKVGTPLRDMEREMIVHTLEMVENNRKHAAQLLGISRGALYSKLHKYEIE